MGGKVISPTLEVSSDARHDLQGGFEAIASNELFRTQILLSLRVLSGPCAAIGLQKLLTVVRKIVLIQGEGRHGFHLQQPIDLLECGGMTLGENFVYDGPNISSTFKGQKETHKRWTHFTRW